jgi:hypothetical protein
MAKVLKGQEKNELDDEHIAYLGGVLVSLALVSMSILVFKN